MADRALINTRYAGRKRASCDSVKYDNPSTSHQSQTQNLSLKESKPKSSGRRDVHQLGELTLTMDMFTNPKKNNLSLNHNSNSINRYQTHRVNGTEHISKNDRSGPTNTRANNSSTNNLPKNKNSVINKQANLSELRQEVEQLRMQNQSIREELKSLKNNQSELKYQKMRVEEEKYAERQAHLQDIENLNDKIQKYTLKIKQLYEQLIKEKKKNISQQDKYDFQPEFAYNKPEFQYSHINQNSLDQTGKLRVALSPTSNAMNNVEYFRNFEEQGQKDYYNGLKKKRGANTGWSMEHSHISSAGPTKYSNYYGTIN